MSLSKKDRKTDEGGKHAELSVCVGEGEKERD